MNIAVRYFSKTGNTRNVALYIAEAAGCQAEPIDSPLEGIIDILFLGGAVYWGKIPEALKTYMRELKPEQVKHVSLFHTVGNHYDISQTYRQFLQNHDLKVMKTPFSCIGKHVKDNEVKEKIMDYVAKMEAEWKILERYEGDLKGES